MDAAALSLKIDSTDVVKATADLDKFTAASVKAGTAAKVGGDGGAKAAAGLSRTAQSAMRAAAMVEKYSSSAMRAAANAQRMAATNDNLASSAANVGKAFAAADAHVSAYRQHLASVAGAGGSAVESIRRTSAAAADSAGAMKANVGNLAAQFQDIGVTAAAGMSPMMIALQQGTQLFAVFAASGGSAFKALGAAAMSVLNPMSLLTIGIVGLVAAGLQMVDWAKLGRSSLNAMADAMVAAAPYAVALGAVLTLAFAPQIIAAVVALSVAIGKALVAAIVAATQAMIAFAIANPFTAFVLAAAAAAAAVVLVGQAFGKDFVTPIRSGINAVVGNLVGGFNAFKAVWATLPAIIGNAAINAANVALAAIDKMINSAIEKINAVMGAVRAVTGINTPTINFRANSGQFQNPYAAQVASARELAAAEMQKARAVDYVGKAIGGVNSLAAAGADKLREWAKALGVGDKTKDGKSAADAAARAAKTDPWADLLANADRQQRALDQAGAQIGVYGEALARLKAEQDLFNQAQDQGIKLNAAMTAELKRRAAVLGAKDYENTRKAAAEAGAVAHAEQMRQLEVERDALGLTGEALASYGYQQQLINQQLAAGVALKDIDLAKIREQGDAYGEAVTAIERQRRAMADAREVTRGFFADWINGAREGKNVFTALGDAAVNALNRIIDKLLDRTLDSFLDGLFSNGPGFLGGLFGGNSSGLVAPAGMSPWDIINSGKKFALGGAFDQVQRFAKGGAFSNQVFNTPTLFRYANGAALGEMGEAGPEAIMPLKRGPDGSLGVKSVGGGGRPQVTINTPIHIHQAGSFTTQDAQAMAVQAGQMAVAECRRRLQGWAQELDQDGTLI